MFFSDLVMIVAKIYVKSMLVFMLTTCITREICTVSIITYSLLTLCVHAPRVNYRSQSVTALAARVSGNETNLATHV